MHCTAVADTAPATNIVTSIALAAEFIGPPSSAIGQPLTASDFAIPSLRAEFQGRGAVAPQPIGLAYRRSFAIAIGSTCTDQLFGFRWPPISRSTLAWS